MRFRRCNLASKMICNIVDADTGEVCQEERAQTKAGPWPFCSTHKDMWVDVAAKAAQVGVGSVEPFEWAEWMRAPAFVREGKVLQL